MTTIAAAVGAGGLGVYIFRGLRNYDNNLLLAGALPAALMALAADFSSVCLRNVFRLKEKSKSNEVGGSPAGIAAMVVIALLASLGIWRALRGRGKSEAGSRVVVASKGFYRIDSAGGDCVSVFGSSRRYR